MFSGGPFRSSQQPAPPVLIQGTWSNGEEPPGGAPAHGGPHPRSSSGTGSVPVGGPDTSQRLSMGGSGEVIPASAFPPQRPQQQQQQPQQRQAAPNMASDPSASSSAQVRDLQHRISVLESQLQASKKCRAWVLMIGAHPLMGINCKKNHPMLRKHPTMGTQTVREVWHP